MTPPDFDIAIIGAGAAGLATAIFTKERQPSLRVALLDGAKKPGAKILVSGGSRCNVTNVVVTEDDFSGGKSTIVRNVLRAMPIPDTIEFFRRIGVALHEEPGGKLFPDSNQSRTVLEALLRESDRVGVALRPDHRVTGVSREGRGPFTIVTSAGTLTTRALVLATGGLSLPKTGSDGWGYQAAKQLGHTIVEPTPALAPLLLGRGAHATLSGVTMPARLDLRVDGKIETRITGSLLWTHFGISGPAALDMSRHLLRARLDGRRAELTMSLAPGEQFEMLERVLIELGTTRPKLAVESAIARWVPASVAKAIVDGTPGLKTRPPSDSTRPPADSPRPPSGSAPTLSELTRDGRRAMLRLLLEWPLDVLDSRGYNYAEVTAGGVALTEIDPSTMESRTCPGLFLVGEILDVDGRIGGFNFQWAWSSARVASGALSLLRSAEDRS